MALSQANALGRQTRSPSWKVCRWPAKKACAVTDHLSLLTDFTTGGLYDDSTIYMLDQQIFGLTSNSPMLPPPRSEQESLWTTAVPLPLRQQLSADQRLLPGPQCDTARSRLPQEALIINRNTFDYNFNSALNPVLHLGDAWIAFNTGIQFTLRRDTQTPQYDESEPVPRSSCTSPAARSATGCQFNGQLVSRSRAVHATRYKLNSSDVGSTLAVHGRTALGQDCVHHRLYAPRSDVQSAGASSSSPPRPTQACSTSSARS